jgi:hypothetical protein
LVFLEAIEIDVVEEVEKNVGFLATIDEIDRY